ncbi:MAG: hypothetical protein AMXMBFR84_24230 [Candidatus Hydrogenedentota bacterium]
MKRGIWTYVFLALAGLALAGALGALGVFVYYQQRDARWLAAAESAYDQGNWNEARDNYRNYIPQDRGNVVLLRKFADACMHVVENRTAAMREAATAYQEILGFQPDDDAVRAELYSIYSKLGEWSSIEYYATEWLKRDEANHQYRYWVAQALQKMNRNDEAIRAYQALAGENTTIAEVYNGLASLLRDRGDERIASQVYVHALEEQPDNARIHIGYARFLARTRDWELVNQQLAQAESIAPGDPFVLMARAHALMLNQKYPEAVAVAQQAVQVDPEYSEGHLFIANLQYLEGDVNAAIDTLRSLDPIRQLDDSYLILTLIDYLYEVKRIDEANSEAARFESAFPENLVIKDYFAAREQLANGDAGKAIETLAPVIELRPEFALGRFALAVAYIEAGKIDLGRVELESYLEQNPGDQRARLYLARQFGEKYSLPDLAAQAKAMLTDSLASSQRLVALARALMDAAVDEQMLETHAAAIQNLLVRATERDPRYAPAYTVTAELLLRRGNTEGATNALDLAAKSGVPAEELHMAQAEVALAKNDESTARSIRDTVLSGNVSSLQAVLDWTSFFLRRGRSGMALETLDAASRLSASDMQRAEIELERAELMAQVGQSAEAVNVLKRIDTSGLRDDQADQVHESILDQLLNLMMIDAAGAADTADAMMPVLASAGTSKSTMNSIKGWIAIRNVPPRTEEARTLFEAALADSPSSVSSLLGLSQIEENNGKKTEALRYATKASRASGGDIAELRLANLQAEMGQFRQAERLISRILSANPNHPQALAAMIRLMTDSARLEIAEGLLDRLTAVLPPENPLLQSAQGRVALASKPAGEAEQILRERLSLAPDDVEAVRNLATLLVRQNRLDEAESILKSFSESNANNPEAWVMLASFYRGKPDATSLEFASSALTRALLADPGYVPALRDMIQVRLKQGNETDALSLCDRYLNSNPDDEDILHVKALLYADMNRNEEALALVDAALIIDPRPEFRATRGLLYTSLNDCDKALHDLEFVAALRDPSAAVDLGMAECFLAKGRRQDALNHFNAAREKFKQGQFLNKGRLDRLAKALGVEG